MKTTKEAWSQLPGMKFIGAFEWRRYVAKEPLDTEGRCPMGSQGKGGSKHAHKDGA